MQKTERVTTRGCRQKGCPPSRDAVLNIKKSQVCFISEKCELRFRFLMRRRLNVDMRSILKISTHSVVGTERYRLPSQKTMGGRMLCKDNVDIMLLTDAARGESTKLWNAFAVFQIIV